MYEQKYIDKIHRMEKVNKEYISGLHAAAQVAMKLTKIEHQLTQEGYNFFSDIYSNELNINFYLGSNDQMIFYINQALEYIDDVLNMTDLTNEASPCFPDETTVSGKIGPVTVKLRFDSSAVENCRMIPYTKTITRYRKECL